MNFDFAKKLAQLKSRLTWWPETISPFFPKFIQHLGIIEMDRNHQKSHFTQARGDLVQFDVFLISQKCKNCHFLTFAHNLWVQRNSNPTLIFISGICKGSFLQYFSD